MGAFSRVPRTPDRRASSDFFYSEHFKCNLPKRQRTLRMFYAARARGVGNVRSRAPVGGSLRIHRACEDLVCPGTSLAFWKRRPGAARQPIRPQGFSRRPRTPTTLFASPQTVQQRKKIRILRQAIWRIGLDAFAKRIRRTSFCWTVRGKWKRVVGVRGRREKPLGAVCGVSRLPRFAFMENEKR
jgi:hypothetical protein